jgi:hypothetical protein
MLSCMLIQLAFTFLNTYPHHFPNAMLTTIRFQHSLLLKWFYNTSIGVVTGAARCGSFVGKIFSLLVVSYIWTR